MPEHVEEYRGVDIRKRGNDYYCIAAGRMLASDKSIEALRRKIDEILRPRGDVMEPSESVRNAMLQLGNSASGHEFLPPEVLNELLELKLVYWRAPDFLDLTPRGEKLYKELAKD